MRAVIQRVRNASVAIEGDTIAAIGTGILVLVGFHREDSDADLDYIIEKTLAVRIFADDFGVMNRSLADIGGELLVISQFTLYGDARKGRRPSYSDAMSPDRAREQYGVFMSKLRDRHPFVRSGEFGADMAVSLVNDGPITILLDSTRLL